MAKRYTPEQIEFLKKNFPIKNHKQVTKEFNLKFGENRSVPAISYCAYAHSFTRKQNFYTTVQINFLKKNYKKFELIQLTELFNKKFKLNVSKEALKGTLERYKIKSGRTGRFKKGNVPFNKGTQGLTKANRTSFKKGNVPHNIKPLGSERKTYDGFIEIKVQKRYPQYKLKHRVIWEKEKGKIPADKVVAFKDSNPLNCDIDNLILLTRAELLTLNQNRYKKTPKELKPTVLLLSQLQTKKNELKNGVRK